MISRRSFLQGGSAALVVAAGTAAYTFRLEPHWLELTEADLPLVGLPSSLHGATLVQLSDVHVGPRVDDDYLLRTFSTVRELSPDIVVYTGDFISFEPGFREHAARIYRYAPRGRLATCGILGNHDYGPNWTHPEVADQVATVLEQSGVSILRNQSMLVDGLRLIGMDDVWAGRFMPAEALAEVRLGAPAIALSHNPDSADLEGWSGFKGWILAGHTHGGQCKPPFLPPPLLPVQNKRYTSGAFELGDGRHMYVSRGIGHLLQVRFNVRPEVTRFRLRAA